MIFPELKAESKIQTDDKIRLDATMCFVDKSESAITLVEIEPEAGNGFINVTGTKFKDWFLDWKYSGASRTVTATVRVTTDGAPVSKSISIQVLTPADDKLFSSDDDLLAIESEALKFLPEHRSSFLNVHRKAQELILSYLDESGFTNDDGSRITKDQVTEIEDVNKWSTYLVLWMIFQDISNKPDDTFAVKAKEYLGRSNFHKERSFIRLDLDSDGTADPGEGEFQSIRTQRMIRR